LGRVHVGVLVILAFLAPVILAACKTSQAAPPPAASAGARQSPSVAVRVAPAVMGSIAVGSEYPATVNARDQVNLAPLSTGRLDKLHVDVGSEVRKGQVIAELSHGTLDAQLQQAQAGVRNAQAKLAAVKAAIGPNQLKAQAQLDAARAKLQQLAAPSALELQSQESQVAKARADVESAQLKLYQLQHPSAADLADAISDVAEAQSKLGDAQANTNAAISHHLKSTSLGADVRNWWQLLLDSREVLAANKITILNLPQVFGLQLSSADVAAAQELAESSQHTIAALLGNIYASSLMPQKVQTAMWAEASAEATLNDARAALETLQSPSVTDIALAQADVDFAEADLASAEAKLALLKSPSMADISAAQSAVAAAEYTFALSQDSFVQQDIAAAQAQVDQAQAQADLVQHQLADLQLLAPFDGFITQRFLAPGALAATQSPIVTLAGKDMVISLRVEESKIGSLQPGQRVAFTSPAITGGPVQLGVERIAPAADEKSHTFQVQLTPLAGAPVLKPGMSGQVDILDGRDNAVLVPKEAVVRGDGQSYIFIVQEGKARRQKVDAGLVDSKNTEVRQGVNAGDRVVVAGQNLLKDGDRVSVEGATERQRPPG